MYDLILAFITSFSMTFLAIPSIISVAKKKNLMDEPGERTSHSVKTPSLGGIGIFAGMLFSLILWTPFQYFGDLQYILCAFIVIFLIGAKDDIDPVTPRTKLLGQLFAAAILVFRANIRLTSLYGVLGIQELPYVLSIIISIFTIVVIINAFNLIDGINGLSGGIGTLISTVLGLWFLKVGHIELSMVAFVMAGSLVAFLYYNVQSKIFMGDTGALLLGLVASILGLKFIELHNVLNLSEPYFVASAPAVAIAILIIPLFDTLRVFIGRILKGKSPFHADRTHIHHLLIDSGLSHLQASGVLVVVNLLFIILAYQLRNLGNMVLMLVLLTLAYILTEILAYIVQRKQQA